MTLELWIAPAVLAVLYVLAWVVTWHAANHPHEPVAWVPPPVKYQARRDPQDVADSILIWMMGSFFAVAAMMAAVWLLRFIF